uniref:Ion transport domain-containing protein n=1 Tax=Anopheles dirus TaxID=7168 RepID=A0A182N3P4_9DIPT
MEDVESQISETEELVTPEAPKSDNNRIRKKRKELQKILKQLVEEAIRADSAAQGSLDKFTRLMGDERLNQMREVIDIMKTWGQLTTIVEPKSFLYHAHLQPVLLTLLEDIVKYRDYLMLFIDQFNAENEIVDKKHHPEQTNVEENGPIHFAVQQLDTDFLTWLLNRSNTDVNLRNGLKKTALHILCERFARDTNSFTQEKVRAMIVQLLKSRADFNICCEGNKLPFALLMNTQLNESAEAMATHNAFLEQCVHLTSGAIAINSMNAISFHGDETTVRVTVELLEIVLRYHDVERFETFLNKFAITPANVRKVIRLLLHTACEEKLPRCFDRIVEHGKHEIFRVVEPDVREQPSTSSSTEITLEPCTQLVYRVELKGLPMKACEMADPHTLKKLLVMIPDLVLLNDEPLLLLTLKKAIAPESCSEYRDALLACAEALAQHDTIHINKRDKSTGNTALHLALKHGLESISAILLHKPYTFLGKLNKENKILLEYGTYAFWRTYLDQCVKECQNSKLKNSAVLDLCLDGFNATPPLQAGEHEASQSAQHRVTDTAILRKIERSKELQRLLLHPVLYTFIVVKWTQICVWNYLNLLLTASTMLFFGLCSLSTCSIDGPNVILRVLSILGAMSIAIRELLQAIILRSSYVTVDNMVDIANLVGMAVVLCLGCYGLVSSFVVICFAMQTTFLLGSLHWNNITITMYMFKTVSINFLKSFLLFLPLIGAFIYSFHLSYNQPSEQVALERNGDDSAQDSFNNFGTIWNATVKTLVMTTGEFDAASINFQSGKILLFVVFLFIAPIVILNLINGLAVNDIAKIRQDSELISISKKVMLLEQYERGIANVSFGWLQRWVPKPFFFEHKSHILVKSKERWNIGINYKKKILKERKSNKNRYLDFFRLTQYMRLERTKLDEILEIAKKN